MPRAILAAAGALLLASGLRAQAPPATVTAAGRAPTLTLGGLLQVQGEFGDAGDSRTPSANDRFFLRRARLNATGRFLEEFDFRLEVEMTGSLSNASGLRGQLTDAYVNWNRYPFANVRVGQFKTPFGFEQLYADPRLPTLERSLANDRLTLSRQIGIQVGGDLLDKRLSWAVGAFNGSGTATNANDNDIFTPVGRLSVQAWRSRLFGDEAVVAIGASAYRSDDVAVSVPDLGFDSTPTTADKDNLLTGKRHGEAIDLELTTKPFTVWIELLRGHFEPANARPRKAFDAEGWTLTGTYALIPDRLQLVLRRESFDPLDTANDDRTTTDTLGLNWFLKGHDLKAMFDLQRVAVDRQDNRQRALLRLQVIF